MPNNLKPLPRSCGFIYNDTFIQCTVMHIPNQPTQELVGLYGDKEFQNVNELATLAGPDAPQIIDKIRKFVNS